MAGAPKRLEIVPYTVADLTHQPTGGNPLSRARPSGAVGMDMKYALTPGLTLTTTINPTSARSKPIPRS
jgi:hypothetical protein